MYESGGGSITCSYERGPMDAIPHKLLFLA
jgi:hypothetical protein